MIFFKTRSAARNFATKTGKKLIDNGPNVIGRRWAVKVIKN